MLLTFLRRHTFSENIWQKFTTFYTQFNDFLGLHVVAGWKSQKEKSLGRKIKMQLIVPGK